MDNPQGNQPVEEKTTSAIPTETKPAESNGQILPDGVSDRTKEEFEKLKQHNAELKEKLSAYENKNSVLDDLRPSASVQVEAQNLNDSQIKEIKSKFVDENGYVDVGAFENALKVADERARQAELRAKQVEDRVSRFEESEQVRDAHNAYPQLNPRNTEGFDPKFYELVKNELIGQMMKGEKDMLKAARKVSEFYTPKVDVSQAKEEAVKEYKNKVTKRDQATESSNERGVSQPTDREELIRKTQSGDRNALFKRLQASGY